MEESPKKIPLLPWDRFENWIHCFCVVTFDLELGQAMELIYPGHVKLTEKEKTNICYLSFPDSNSESGIWLDTIKTFRCMGDTQFHFRIRRCPTRRPSHSSSSSPALANLLNYNRNCPPALLAEDAYYYGYVYFRQIKDKTIRRGYFQKSLVLLSRLPFLTLFNHLVSVIAPSFFDDGIASLEAACHNIDQWAEPVPDETLTLPLLGTLLEVRVPSKQDKVSGIAGVPKVLSKEVNAGPACLVISSLHEVDMFTALQPTLVHVQLLWELVLTCEPLVVMTSQPTLSSTVVQALVDMIWPLQYCADYRPFFTIHDSEFKEYTTRTQAPPGVLLGVTNPFFIKTLQHWPHVLRIGDMPEGSIGKAFSKKKKSVSMKALDCKPGVYTQYKPFLAKDKTILKKLTKGISTKRPAEVQSAMLKRYLLELTHSFMIPLERYIASLMPLHRNISPHKGVPRIKSFDAEVFISSLDQTGPHLTSGIKGDWVGLYRRFLHSANFEGWLRYRQNEVNQKLQELHIEVMCNTDLVSWIRGKNEVEVVDLVLRLKDKLASIHSNVVIVPKSTEEKLKSRLEDIINSLPSDLRSVIS